MKNVNINELEALLEQIHSNKVFMDSLPRSGNKYFKEVRRETVEEFLHLSGKEKVKRTLGKNKQKAQMLGNECCWGFGEHKLFCLLAQWVRQRSSIGQQINSTSSHDIGLISSIFNAKQLGFLQYELQLINFDPYSTRDEWTEQEVQTLLDLIRRNSSQTGDEPSADRFEWKRISFDLFTCSGSRYFRTPHQCSEKYRNYFSPVLNKSRWTIEEDIVLLELVEKYEFKWSLIAKNLVSKRTQHMVKNRCHSILKNLIKKRNEDVNNEQSLALLAKYKQKLMRKVKNEQTSPHHEMQDMVELSSSQSQSPSQNMSDHTQSLSSSKKSEPIYESDEECNHQEMKAESFDTISNVSGKEPIEYLQVEEIVIDQPEYRVSYLENLLMRSKEMLFNQEWLQHAEEASSIRWLEEY